MNRLHCTYQELQELKQDAPSGTFEIFQAFMAGEGDARKNMTPAKPPVIPR